MAIFLFSLAHLNLLTCFGLSAPQSLCLIIQAWFVEAAGHVSAPSSEKTGEVGVALQKRRTAAAVVSALYCF